MPNEVQAPLREVRWRVACGLALVCLAVDSLNPAKILTEITGISPNAPITHMAPNAPNAPKA